MNRGGHSAERSGWGFLPNRSVAGPQTWRGHLWTVVLAVDFFLVSNPLVFELSFFTSLSRALLVTSAALILTLPWAPIPRLSVPLLAFLAWGLVSVAWSIGPSTTLLFWLQAAVVAAIAITLAAQVDPVVMARGLVLGGVLVSGLSWYAHLNDLPGASFETLDGLVGIAGVGTNRNILAYTLVISLGAVVAHVPRSWPGRFAWLGAGAFIVFTIYSADSTTGYSAGLAAIAASLSVVVFQRYGGWVLASRRRLWTSVLGVVGTLSAILYTLAKMGGEDILTVSGRLPVWEAGWHVVSDQVMIGYGWGAVWAHPWAPAGPNDVAEAIYVEAGVFLSHGHNSLIDVLVELGLIGAALVVLVHGRILYNGLRDLVSGDPHASGGEYPRLLLATLAAIAVSGISEPMSVIPVGWWSLLLLMHLNPTRTKPSGPSPRPDSVDVRSDPDAD